MGRSGNRYFALAVQVDELVYDLVLGLAFAGCLFFEGGQKLIAHIDGDHGVPLSRQGRLLRRAVMGGVLRARLLMLLRARLLMMLLRARLLRARGRIAETGVALPRAVAGRAAARLLREGVGHQVHAIVGRDGFLRSPASPVSLRIRSARGFPVVLT